MGQQPRPAPATGFCSPLGNSLHQLTAQQKEANTSAKTRRDAVALKVALTSIRAEMEREGGPELGGGGAAERPDWLSSGAQPQIELSQVG